MSEDNFKNSMVVIRFKNKRQTFNNFQKSSFLYFGLYITLQLVIIFGIGYLGSLSYSESSLLLELQDMLSWQMGWEQINVNDFSPLRMGLILGFLRIIELMMMQIFFLNLKALTKNTLVSFLVVMSLYGLLFLVGGYIPIGISSFIRIILLSSNFYYASLKAGIILLVTYGISYLFIYVSGYKKLF